VLGGAATATAAPAATATLGATGASAVGLFLLQSLRFLASLCGPQRPS